MNVFQSELLRLPRHPLVSTINAYIAYPRVCCRQPLLYRIMEGLPVTRAELFIFFLVLNFAMSGIRLKNPPLPQ
jgi:hypothetical protein